MKLIHVPHKVCGMTCMVNGLEDLYEWKTGTRLPDWVLFYLSGMAGFASLAFKQGPLPRFVGWGTTVKAQYKLLADAVGFRWTVNEGHAFKTAFKAAQASIDQGVPVILGALDMYHLPYHTQFYHQTHIPIHYVLLVGYDDQQRLVLVQDCDREAVQAVPYDDLQQAWNVHVPGLSTNNTFFAFAFDPQPADVYTMARRALRKKAELMLTPPVRLFGIPAMRKLARELPGWPNELARDQLDRCLRQMVEYTGTPPMLPARLSGETQGALDYSGGRTGFSQVLARLAQEYQVPAWVEASQVLAESGRTIERFTELVVDYVLGLTDALHPAATLLEHIAALEEQAYTTLLAADERVGAASRATLPTA